MKLGGPAAQQRSRVEIGADSPPGLIRDRLAAQGNERRMRDFAGTETTGPRNCSVVFRQSSQSELPGIALICDVALEHAKRTCGSAFIQVFDVSGERRHIPKRRFLHQKDTDLQIGVQPWFDAAEHFQHQAFVIDHRAVALLRVHERWGERPLSGPPEGFQRGGGDGANLPSDSAATTRGWRWRRVNEREIAGR